MHVQLLFFIFNSIFVITFFSLFG